jgi:shikimate kinase
MMNVCFQCGMYHADKIIDPAGPFAVCPECGFQHPFRQLPLLIVSGASGAGKTTVCQHLTGQVTQAVLLDSDILWRSEFNSPETNYRDYFELWLRLCKNISQSGRPVVLFGAGAGVPENIENCIERRYFSNVHYLALVCSDDALSERLQARPIWRGTRDAEYIDGHIRFNHWFKEYDAQPAIERIDTTNALPEETVAQVASWINERAGASDAQISR